MGPQQAPPLSQFKPATVEEITRLINTMPAKSCSLDPIPMWLLKRLTPHIAPVICKLCNLSLHNDVFPTQLKQALVLPIPKTNNLDLDVASSYRPISNLLYISKVIERVVARQFSSHLSHSSLLRAYRPFHSTETAVLSVHNDVARCIDNGQVSLLVLLDLSAAFDTVDHQILQSILPERFAVADIALSWFSSYLTDRTQQFTYAGSCTPSFTVDCSVPQRSVLGPLEFIVYTEDIVQLADYHNTSSHLYVDTQLYASCRPEDFNDVRTCFSSCITDVAQWCASRHLQLNGDKTEAIWFGSHANLRKLANHDCSVCVGSESIQLATDVRDLGAYLDAELTMYQHVSKIAAASFFHLRRLHQIRRRVSTEVTIRLVLALIHTRLLQLVASWRATVHPRCVAACPECRSLADF